MFKEMLRIAMLRNLTALFALLLFLTLIIINGTGCALTSKISELKDKYADSKAMKAAVKAFYEKWSDPDEEDQPEENYPFEWSELTWVCGDVKTVNEWPITIHLVDASIGGDTVSWGPESQDDRERILAWPSTKSIKKDPNACVGWVAKINDKWYAAIAEWLTPGQFCQSKKIFKSDRGGDNLFNGDLEEYEPEKGQEFYLFVCGLNMCGQRNVSERSNLVKIAYK